MEEWLFKAILRLPALLLGIGLHEWAHAYAADRHGDSLPSSQGRLSLNPLDHLDPLGTLCIFVAPIGWGKPVMINPLAYRNPLKDQMRIALAGPMMNFLIVAVTSLIYWAFVSILPYIIGTIPFGDWVVNVFGVIKNIIMINLGLGIFNLIPIPPLDGSKVARAIGSVEVAEMIGRIESGGYGMLIILILIMTNLINPLFIPMGYLMTFLLTNITFSIGFTAVVVMLGGLFLSTFPKLR